MPLEISSQQLTELRPYYKNPRKGNVDAIAESLRARGQYKPIVVNVGTHTGRPMEILAGNHTYLAAAALSWDAIDVVTVDVPDEQAAQIVLADNRIADLGDYDDDLLRDVLGDAGDLTGTGYTDADLEAMFAEPEPTEKSSLAAEFGAPPLTVLSSRAGEWQTRKKAWMDAGLKSEAGRDEALVYDSPQARFINWYKVKNAAEAAAGHALTDDAIISGHKEQLRDIGGGTSVFDPALAEVILAWYSAPGSRIIDPWAGGAVRGVVSAALGREYVGIELRPEQIEANRAMMPVVKAAAAAQLCDGDGTAEWLAGTVADALGDLPDESFDLAFSEAPAFPAEVRGEDDGTPDSRPRWVDPEWIEGDSTVRLATVEAESFDMALGCPPYYDLESYSDDPRDLSNLTPVEFDAAMARTVAQVARVLRENSFAVFVVGSVRDKKGHILDMRRCMSQAAEAAGMALVNDAVLLTPVGSAAMRAARGFRGGRTLARVHQEVLVYVKGSRKKATERLGPVSFAALREAEGDTE